jgi:flagellar hook-associated protein 3 FlgL
MGAFAVSTPRVSNNLRAQLILSNLNHTSEGLLRLQNQISSGKRVMTPSDDPVDAVMAEQLQSFLEQKARFQESLKKAVNVLAMADSSLGEATDAILQAKEIGLEEIGTTATSATRQSSAAIINELINSMISVGNTQFAGRYIFSGRSTLTAPFESVTEGIYFGGDTGEVEVSIDYSANSSTSVDAATAFGAISTEVRGREDLDPVVTLDTLLADLNGGKGVQAGSIIISDGTTVSTVDLSGARTVRDVISAINASTPPTTTASILVGGTGIEIATSTGTLTITDALGGSTASDLGILRTTPAGPLVAGDDIDPLVTQMTTLASMSTVDWTSGLEISNGSAQATLDFTGCNTVQDVINRINSAGLYVEAKINDDGKSLDIVSRLSGTMLQIGENGGTTASDLGLRTMDASTSLSTLNDGLGVDRVSGDDVTFTLKDATAFSVDLSGASTLQDVIDAVNTAAGNPGTLTASLAATGNGIVLTDASGGAGDLSVTRANYSNAAEDLGILTSTAGSVITGEDRSGAAADGVLTHLMGLKNALLANDDAAISYYTDKLEADYSQVLEARASLGARQQRMSTVEDRLSADIIELQSMLSDRVDLDYAEGIVKYSTLQAAYEAGLQTAGSFLQMSLIDFLG